MSKELVVLFFVASLVILMIIGMHKSGPVSNRVKVSPNVARIIDHDASVVCYMHKMSVDCLPLSDTNLHKN